MNRKQLLIGLVAVAVIVLAVAAYLTFFGGGSESSALASANATRAGVTIAPDDMTLGSPKAPIVMLEYAAPTCPVCAHFEAESFPVIKKEYIDTGKVYYIFRVFPLQSVDLAAEALLRCVPKEQYFQFLQTLFRNQDKWDPDGYNIPDVHGALLQMARIAGMNVQQADKCMADQNKLGRASKVGADAQTRYNISGTPSFIINGELHVGPSDPPTWRKLLDSLLKKK